jgi:hypothetical protein
MTSLSERRRQIKAYRGDATAPETYHLGAGPGLCLEIRRGFSFWLYAATPLATDYGTAFHLERVGGPSEGYDVILDGSGSSCDCPDHVYRSRQCKHLRLVAAWVKGGVR